MSNAIGPMEVDDVEPWETMFKINETTQHDKVMEIENLKYLISLTENKLTYLRIELDKLIRNS